MALYDGFFDAALADDGGYDREYNAAQVVEYFESFIGSGVCIYQNEDSFKVRYEGGNAVVSPGYLFINGYWLKNDEDYSISVSAGKVAIIAQLSKAGRMINLGTSNNTSGAIGNALVLAYVTVSANGDATVTDKRYDADVCGIIDSVGGLNNRIEYILDYVDNSLGAKLDGMSDELSAKISGLETQVNQQVAQLYSETETQANLLNATTEELTSELETKLAEAENEMSKMEPLDVGSVRFSAAAMNDKWLICDGSYVSAEQYPALVEALKGSNPTSDRPVLLSNGGVGLNISNGVLYEGRMWTYSYSEKKLYGISVTDGNIKIIPVSSADTAFNTFKTPTDTYPIALSIVPHKIGSGAALFICQILNNVELNHIGDSSYYQSNTKIDQFKQLFLIYTSEFTGNENSLSLSYAFDSNIQSSGDFIRPDCLLFVPYVISELKNGVERYYCLITQRNNNKFIDGFHVMTEWYPLSWTKPSDPNFIIGSNMGGFGRVDDYGAYGGIQHMYIQRVGYSKKARGEALSMITYTGISGSGKNVRYIEGHRNYSANQNILYSSSGTNSGESPNKYFRNTFGPMNVAGDPFCVVNFTGDKMNVTKSGENAYCAGIETGITLPADAKVFVDACGCIWGKSIYFFFVGTGLLFSKEMKSNTFGYLDTTGTLGKIVNFGYIDFNDDETELYILGQTDENKIVFGKIVLNNLKNYNTSGAFLPNMPASANGGIPAYIKALEG